MKCPRCQKPLEKAIFHNTEVDYCPQCFGIFFEEDELRQAKDAKDKNLSWLDIDLWQDEKKFKISYGIRLCPSCRLPLYEVYYGDSRIVAEAGASSPPLRSARVIVDVCNLCHGIWLDRGEFKKIIEYLKEKAIWLALQNYAKALFEEFQEIFTGPETLREEVLDFLIILKILNYKFAIQHPKITKIISNLPR